MYNSRLRFQDFTTVKLHFRWENEGYLGDLLLAVRERKRPGSTPSPFYRCKSVGVWRPHSAVFTLRSPPCLLSERQAAYTSESARLAAYCRAEITIFLQSTDAKIRLSSIVWKAHLMLRSGGRPL